MKKIITLLMLTFIVSISFAQYTPMTAAGYQFKRILCDSTLHIPSFCGIPTLRNSTAKNGAIAMDTCNYRFYMWTNIGGWSQIVGAGTDTTSLSLRIDQRVKYTDTAQMLLAYLRKQDTANRFVANVIKVNDSTLRVFKGNTITDLKILGKQTDTTSLSNRIDQKLGKADSTTYYTKYRSDTSRTNIYNAINTKLNKTDTTNKFVNAVTKVNDSTIRVWKGTTSTTIELPRGSGGGGSGTVTNVGTGYGLSGGPITSTGTIIVDSATLSTKYLRRADTSNLVATKSNVALKLNIADTTNKFVNNVTKINDTAIRVWKGTTSTVISLAKDVVYTQSPIMSKISNDSNIIYFNADTADVWRGGGSGTTPTLEQVTTAGNTSTNTIQLNQISNILNTDLNVLDVSSGYAQYWPIKWYDSYQNGYGGIKTIDDQPGAIYPEFRMFTLGAGGVSRGWTLNETELSWDYSGYKIKVLPIESNYPSANYDLRLPVFDNSFAKDTIATLRDLRGGGGGGGTGTVTNVATGYGLSGGPITNTGTLIVDTATLSGKYIQGSGTTNYVPKFSATRELAISQIFDNGTSVGINTASPTSTYKLDVNGIINTNNGVNITTNGSKTGFYGTTNALDIFAGNNKIGTYGLANIGGSIFDHNFSFNYGGSTSGTVNSLRIASNVIPNGNNSVDINQLIINPTYQQITGSGTGTGTLRGIYYNPTLTSLGTSKNIAFQSTSGDIIFNNLKTSSSTSDSIAIFINDTLKKAPYPSGVATPTGYYGAFQDNTSQTAASINTAYPVKFNTTDLTNGVSVVNDGSSNPTRITLANTGIYNIQFSLQLEKTGGSGNMIADIWIRKNGVDIPSTTGKVVLTGSANASPIVAAWNYVLDLAAGDYVQLMWSTSNTNVEIISAGATSPHPAIPSSILTVTQQSGIMAGTGITAINSLTGAAQTIVAGTSGTDFAVSSTGTTHTLNLPNASASNRGALTSANWTTFNNKIGASDTSVLQRKSISAYTMLANNTNAASNATAQTFRDTAGTYAGTITFTGTAPTTQTINYYQWQQTGKWVRLQIFGSYTNAGTGITAVQLTIPSDCPAPDISMFQTAANAILYNAIGGLGLSATALTITTNAYMRRNAANNGNELFISVASNNYRRYQIDITYRAQ